MRNLGHWRVEYQVAPGQRATVVTARLAVVRADEQLALDVVQPFLGSPVNDQRVRIVDVDPLCGM